jgi:hypothetical protein
MIDAPQSIYGMRVHIEPQRPRYVLPLDVPPGTNCTRSEFEEWSKMVCGYQAPFLKDGFCFKTSYGLHMNANTFALLKINGEFK